MKLIPYAVALGSALWAWPASTGANTVYAQLFALTLVVAIGFDAVASAISNANKKDGEE